jgi:hypothetical protein
LLDVRDLTEAGIWLVAAWARLERHVGRRRLWAIITSTVLTVTAAVTWLVGMPRWTAYRAVHAFTTHDRAGLAATVETDSLLSEFYQQIVWRAHADSAASAPPAAQLLSVKPEAMDALRAATTHELEAMESDRPWVLSGVTMAMTGGMRTSHGAREYEFRATTPGGVTKVGWMRMRQVGASWKVVGITDLFAMINTLFQETPATPPSRRRRPVIVPD